MIQHTEMLSLIRQVFELDLKGNPAEEQYAEIRTKLLAYPEYYLIILPDGTHLCENHELAVFLDKQEAERFARQQEEEVTPSLVSCDGLFKIIAENEAIYTVKIILRRPLVVSCPAVSIRGKQDDTENLPAQFALVEEIKTVLDLSEPAERRKLDPGLSYENLHTVMEKLIYENRLDMEQMEKELVFPPGMLHGFCQDKVSSSISKESAMKLLDFFGLGEYLYQYKRYCDDVMAELKQNPHIDAYEITPATIHTAERFTITHIRRGMDKRNHAYVYELILKSNGREMALTVSTPLGYVAGKEYEIVGLEPMQLNPQKEAKQDSPIPANKTTMNLFGSPETASRAKKPQQNQEEQDYNTIIRYFKETAGDNLEAAETKYDVFRNHLDIAHAFAVYIKTHRPGRIKEFEYTPGLLMKELHYPPYEAYTMLVNLREKPKETKQVLVYRKTDPQYQTKSGRQEN